MKFKIIIAVAVLFTLQATAQLNTFRGTGFEIKYPTSFKAHGAPGTLEMSLESVFFSPPDNLVEFYIFSPQTSGVANDILVRSNEKQSQVELQKGGSSLIKYWTISAKDGSYERTYQETVDVNSGDNWIIGLKYKNQSAFAQYRNDYLAFKKSYRKTGTNPSTSISNNTMDAKFYFEELAEDAAGISKTVVYIEYNNKKIKLDTIYGSATTIEKSNYDVRKIPKTALEACGAWYGGGGTYFYMIQKGTKLQIFKAYADEEAPQSNWEKIKEL
jgi:hypothetical protein